MRVPRDAAAGLRSSADRRRGSCGSMFPRPVLEALGHLSRKTQRPPVFPAFLSRLTRQGAIPYRREPFLKSWATRCEGRTPGRHRSPKTFRYLRTLSQDDPLADPRTGARTSGTGGAFRTNNSGLSMPAPTALINSFFCRRTFRRSARAAPSRTAASSATSGVWCRSARTSSSAQHI